MDKLIQDLRYALRSFARSPRFTFAALATLAVGIGTNAPLFSGVHKLLMAVAALAAWIPARRAARVDPITALRNE